MSKLRNDELRDALAQAYEAFAAKTTPREHPHFNLNIQPLGEHDSVTFAQVLQVQYLGWGSNITAELKELELPDQVTIYPAEIEPGPYRAIIAGTCLHATKEGMLCCIVQAGGENPAWAILPVRGPEGDAAFYASVREVIEERNEKWGYKLPKQFSGKEWLNTDPPEQLSKQGIGGLAHPLHDHPALQVPNDPASILFTRMITQPKLWQTNENECHKYAQDGRNKAVVIYRPDEEIPEYWIEFRERVLQSLESRFAGMKGELVADVADILFWHWLSNGRPSYANITLAQVLEYRGVKARPNTTEEHWQAMRDVRAIRLRGDGIESEALFHISAAQPNLFGKAEPPKLATVYRYHPGYFLSEAIQRDAFFLAYYARSVWQLDYYRDAVAKKLARVLRADWRRNAESYLPDSKPRYRTWSALLADAGIETESALAQTDPTRFIKSIERELEKLYQNEFVRECAPAIYHPDDQAKRAALPRKGALAAWLALRTHIAPAADITEALTQTAARRLARKARVKALAESSKKSQRARKRA